MTDTTILYGGIVCFGLILVAFGITAWEFHKMSRRAPSQLDPRGATGRGETWSNRGESVAKTPAHAHNR